MSAQILLALRMIIVLFLYAFLAWALYTLWISIKRSSKTSEDRQIPKFTIIQIGGDNGDETVYPFTQSNIIIGRDPLCDLELSNDTISAQHSKISYELGQWWLDDLDSTNGTFLNEEPVAEPVVITDSDRIRCGKIELTVQTSHHDSDS